MEKVMLRRICFLACCLSPLISVYSLHERFPIAPLHPLSRFHILQRRSAQNPSLNTLIDLDEELNPQNKPIQGYDLNDVSNNYPYTPIDHQDSRSAQFSTKAEASAIESFGSNSENNNLVGEGIATLESIATDANSKTSALSEGVRRHHTLQRPYGPRYPVSSSSPNQVAAQTANQALIPQIGYAGNYAGSGYQLFQPGSNSALANGLVSNGLSQASSNAPYFVNSGGRLFSRVISNSEYILPQQIPGGQEVLNCRRSGELHYFWSEDYDCLVCVCLQDLTAICASCGGCIKPPVTPILPSPPPIPPHPIPPSPSPSPKPPSQPARPQPFPDVTCSPLPSNQPFQNPLNPCQICVCREQPSVFGKTDVQIDCHDNPQCVLPAEPIPPIPEPPVPVPLPLCDKFPMDVFFPHPTNACLTCKCVVVPLALVPVRHLACIPNPDCESSTPVTVPKPNPSPWPTIPPINPESLPPGPLPGPMPHESCRPYTPNQSFQHPWDDCQLCVCTEGFALNQVIVEVNCFTKKSCCREYAQPFKPLPLPQYPIGDSSNAEASSPVNAQGSGGLIPYPELGYQLGGSQSSAAANAQSYINSLQGGSLAESDVTAITNSAYNQHNPGYLGYGPNVFEHGNSFAEADANANLANTILNLYQPNALGYLNIVPGSGYNTNLMQGGSLAETDASALANFGYNTYQVNPTNYMNYVPYSPSGYPIPSAIVPIQNPYGVVDASSLANAALNLPYQQAYYPNILPGLEVSAADADASAITKYPSAGYVTGYNYPDILHGQGSSFADSQVSAVSNIGYNQYKLGYTPGSVPLNRPGLYHTYPQLGQVSSAVADANAQAYGQGIGSSSADAIANSNQFGFSGTFSNFAQADANAKVLDAGYSRLNQGLYPAYGSSQSQVQAQSQTQGLGQSQAQSQAQVQTKGQGSGSAQASAISAIKSADPALQDIGDTDNK